MTCWFTYTGGCTRGQASELDALAEALGMGDEAGLDLFAQAQASRPEKARHFMSIERADRSIDWAEEKLSIVRHRRAWRAS